MHKKIASSLAIVILTFLFVFVNTSFAQDLNWISIDKFDGGLCDDEMTWELADNECSDILNCYIDEVAKGVSKRKGFAKANTSVIGSSESICNLHSLTKSDGSKYLWAVSSGTIFGSSDGETFTSVKSGLSTTYDVNWTNIGDSAYCVDGSTWSQKFTAYDSCTAVTTVPRGRFIIEEGYRLWVGYPVGYPNRLYYSDLADDITWNWVYIPGEGEITGLGKLQGSPIVYKTNSVWKVIGTQVTTEEDVYFVPSLVNLSSEVGCVNHRSIQNIRVKGRTIQVFLGKDNVYATNGVSVVPVGDNIKNTIEDLKQAAFASSLSWLETNFTEGTSVNIDTTTVFGILQIEKNGNPIANNSLEDGTGGDPSDFDNWTEYTSVIENGIANLVRSNSKKKDGTYSCYLYAGYSSSPGAATARVTSDTFTYRGGDITLWGWSITSTSYPGASALDSSDNVIKSYSWDTPGSWQQKTFSEADLGSYIGDPIKIRLQAQSSSMIGTKAEGYFDLIEYDYYKPSGNFTSQYHDCGSEISEWGNFIANDTLDGQTIDYAVRSSSWVTGGDLPSGTTWYSVVSGNVLSCSVNRYVQWVSTLTITDYTKTPIVDDVTVHWWAGAFTGSSPSSVVYDDRYHLFAMTSGSDINDIDLVLNEDGAWTKNDIGADSAIIYDNKFYTGTSSTAPSGGYVYQQDIGHNDDDSAIDSYWQSKDYTLGYPYKDKTLRKIWTVAKKSGDYNLNMNYIIDLGNISSDYDIWLSSGVAIVTEEHHIPSTARGKFFRFKVSNSGSDEPWELYQIKTGLVPAPGWSEP